LEIELHVGLPLVKVRDDLPLLYNLYLLIDTIAVIALFTLVYLNGFLNVVDLGRRSLDILSPQMPMIVLFHNLLNQNTRLVFLYVPNGQHSSA
jgi:hypothetical protein